jgi:hypothetical protein
MPERLSNRRVIKFDHTSFILIGGKSVGGVLQEGHEFLDKKQISKIDLI